MDITLKPKMTFIQQAKPSSMSKCNWCKLEFDSAYESTLPSYHDKCNEEMKSENVQLKTLFDKLFIACRNDRMDIQIKESDIPKDIYFKVKNRDVSKLTRNQTLNKELDVLNNLPDEE